MPQLPHTDSVGATLTTDEQFLDLLFAEADLLRAEFDAIIAAEWPTPPSAPGRSEGLDQHTRPGRWPRDAAASLSLANRPHHPGIGGWGRQRSPPARGPRQAKTGKAGEAPT